MVVRPAGEETGGGGGGASDKDWDRNADDLDDDRAARHTSVNTSSVRSGPSRHERQHSGASSSYSSQNGKTVTASWRDAFVRLQADLGPNPTPGERKAAMVQFFDNLPPYYASAAIEFIKMRKEEGEPINLDALGYYFTMLDQAAAEARKIALARSTPPPRSSHSPPIRKRSPLSVKGNSFSPTSPRGSRERHLESDTDHFTSFAPSRPLVSNLLLSDTRDDDSRSNRSTTSNSHRDSPR